MTDVAINVCYLQALASKSSDIKEVNAPDSYRYSQGNSVPSDYVLCRDKNNIVTAFYGSNVWDLKPYRLSATGTVRMNFGRLMQTINEQADAEIVEEVKWIMFSLMHHISSGAAGFLSVTTLMQYFNVAMGIAQFCIDSRNSQLVSSINVSDVLSNKLYLSAYTRTIENVTRKQKLHALLVHLSVIGKANLGYQVVYDSNIYQKKVHEQHPLIPTRIYLEIINFLTNRVEFLKSKTLGLEAFIKEFSDPYFGLLKKPQRAQQLADGIQIPLKKLTMKEAIVSNGLEELFFHPDYEVKSRASLNGALTRIQFEMKCLIHLYTGMRNDEVNRLRFNCIQERVVTESVTDEFGNILVPSGAIELISTTTKFSGFQEEESWLAHPVVLDAITVLRRIAKGYSDMAGIEEKDCPLLVSTVKIFMKNFFGNRVEVSIFKPAAKSFMNKPEFQITLDDFNVLQASDPSRDFALDGDFQCGSKWPLTTHQFRRSLAFYAVNSKFVSLPTLMRQFKHLSQEMTKYYSRNNENVKTIFGHYDVKEGKYVLPLSHVAYEFQVGMSLATAEAILADLLDKDVRLHGKTGGYLEKERAKLLNGEVLVEQFKEETIKKARNGEISYRKTLLGGCTNNETCECLILGEFAECLTSKCAVITSSRIESLILSTQKELLSYEHGSIEYLATESELEDLFRYKKYSIERCQIENNGEVG